MKKIVFAFSIPLLVLTLIFTGGFTMIKASPIKVDGVATFHKNAFVGVLDACVSEKTYAIITSTQEMEEFIQRIIAHGKQDTATVPSGYWESFEAQVREFYAKYNPEFFTSNNLVVAIVDQGSGNVSYQLDNAVERSGVLYLDIVKKSPIIQTMDFVTWVLIMGIEKDIQVESVCINLTQKTV